MPKIKNRFRKKKRTTRLKRYSGRSLEAISLIPIPGIGTAVNTLDFTQMCNN